MKALALALSLFSLTALADVYVGGGSAGATSECLVTNAGGGTVCPASALAGRRSLEIFNNGPNAIYCTVDGTAPVVNKARPIAPGTSWAVSANEKAVVTCIAATAAQLTTAATIVSEVGR